MNMISIIKAIDSELRYQDHKWNAETTTSKNEHSIEEWVQYMEVYLGEMKNHLAHTARQDAHVYAMDMMRNVVTMGVRCMEQHGAQMRLFPEGDYLTPSQEILQGVGCQDCQKIRRDGGDLCQKCYEILQKSMAECDEPGEHGRFGGA